MIAITSISPTHINKDIQSKAIASWIELGMEVYSINCKKEAESLREEYPNVTFIETFRTMQLTYGKPLVSINAAIDWAKGQTDNHFCLINSDVELKTDKDTIERIKDKMKTSVVLDNRCDYELDYNASTHKYLAGIDVFFIHRKWMPFYPQSMHCFGMTFWDYYIPYIAIANGIDVIFLEQKIAFHKKHAAQYSADNWKKSGRFFLWENNLYQFNDTTDIGRMSTYVYNYIYNASKRIQI